MNAVASTGNESKLYTDFTAAKLWAYLHTFFEKCHYFRNESTIRRYENNDIFPKKA